MRVKKQMKLRNNILISTILIAAVTILAFGAVSGVRFQELLTERMVEDYQETMNATQKNVETLISYMQDFSKYMALDERVADTITEYQSMTEANRARSLLDIKEKWNGISNQLIFSTSMIYSLEIYSEDERIYSYYDGPVSDENINIPEEVLEQALNQSPPVWSDLLTLKQYRAYKKKPLYGFAVVKSVRNEAAVRNGAIAVYVRESSFSDILETSEDGQKSRTYLVNGDGTVLSALDKEELYGNAVEVLGMTDLEYETCIEEEVLLKEQKGQVPLLYLVRKLGNDGLKLICEVSMDELSIQQRDLRVFIGVSFLLGAILAFISAWYVSNKITKPLGELMDIMKRIQTDEKSSSLRFPEGNTGEVGVLGQRFNALMDELDASMQQIYEEQRQRRHNEVRLLQAQIVPHFLYNTMGIIASFIRLGMTDKALTTIQNLVSFYRLSLSSGKEIISLREEVELTRNYMELQQLRYIEYMDYSIECEKKAENVWVPKLTIQPLMENVLHHGLKPGAEKCMIQVKIMLEKDHVRISVHDNGTGIEPRRLDQIKQSLKDGKSITQSFGIFNINQRLKLLYGEKYHMEIESVEGEFTQFTLFIPIRKENEGDTYV